MLKRFDLYLLKTFIGPLIITFIIADFVLLMQFFWAYVDELVGKGLEWYYILQLMFYASAVFVPMALPIGVLLSSLMIFGNLGERYELVALKSAGISLWRIIAPLFTLIVFVSIFSFYFCNYILPKANLKFDSIFFNIRRQKMAFNLTEGVYYSDIDGYVIKVNKKEKDDKTLQEIIVYNHKDAKGANSNVSFAKSGTMEVTPDGSTLVMTLFDGYNYDDSYSKDKKENYPFKRIKFEKETLTFDLSQFALDRSDNDAMKKNYRNLNFVQLKDEILRLENTKKSTLKKFIEEAPKRYNSLNMVKASSCFDLDCSISMPLLSNFSNEEQLKILQNAIEHAKNTKSSLSFYRSNYTWPNYLTNQNKLELHRRTALAFACIVMFFVGAPLGAIIRKGGLGLPLVLSITIFVLYYILLTACQKAALNDKIIPLFGAWLANLVVMPFGVFLTAKATTDSPIVDRDAWSRLLVKHFKHLFLKS